jgi:hypothetical protein
MTRIQFFKVHALLHQFSQSIEAFVAVRRFDRLTLNPTIGGMIPPYFLLNCLRRVQGTCA